MPRSARSFRAKVRPVVSCRIRMGVDRSGKAAVGGLKVSGQNDFFVDPGVRKKAVSGLGLGPVLAGKRNAFAEPGRELLEQLLQALVQSPIWKGATGEFLSLNKPVRMRPAHRRF